MDNRNDLYNLMLRNNYIKLEFTDISTNFMVNIQYDEGIFTKEELKNLNFVKNKLKGYTSNELSEWSHRFKGYKETKNGQIINYKYAKYLDFNDL